MNNSKRIRKITGIAMFLALTVALQFGGNYIGSLAAINLGLITIILGAMIYGPVAGLILGLADGAIVLAAPSTISFFFALNPVATIVVCLLKTGLAGLVSGFIFKLFKNKKSIIGNAISSIIVPIINTGIFIVFVYFFFKDLYGSDFGAYVGAILSFNFLVEVVYVSVLAPSLNIILRVTNTIKDE